MGVEVGDELVRIALLAGESGEVEDETAPAEFSVVDDKGVVFGEGALTPDEDAEWVDWINPLTGESMGTGRRTRVGMGCRASRRWR